MPASLLDYHALPWEVQKVACTSFHGNFDYTAFLLKDNAIEFFILAYITTRLKSDIPLSEVQQHMVKIWTECQSSIIDELIE